MSENGTERGSVAASASASAEVPGPYTADSKITDVSSLRVDSGSGTILRDRVLQRVVFPMVDDPLEVRPLYFDEPDLLTGRTVEVQSRRSVTVPPTSQVSFASYFNAFPASYWKRYTTVDEVALRLVVHGAGRVDLYRSKPNGDIVHLQGRQLDTAGEPVELEFRVSLAPFEDGGWIWFDAATRHDPLTISDAAWIVETPQTGRRLAIAITTFNRPADCVAALLALSDDDDVLHTVETVFVVDQGDNKVRNHADFELAEKRLGGRLRLIEQANLGGSGGFTRGMLEASELDDVDHVLLMDDDVRLEPDSVLRTAAFAAAATEPVIVGAQMLNLQARSRLHAMGEIVDLQICFWRPATGSVYDHDFSELSLRQQRLLHARIHSTYNGWWMCLIPKVVIERTGLPLPLFIKWDDAEYSLRAAALGFPTVSMPGAAVWHMPWTDKNDATDWTAYFHLRNRLITMALHSPYDVRRVLVQDSLRNAFKHLMAMEYSTVALHLKAIEDFLAGPEHLFDLLHTALPEVRALRADYDDARTVPSAQQFPAPTWDPSRVDKLLKPPVNPLVIGAKAAAAVMHNLRRPDPSARDTPQINVPARNALWFLLGAVDSATVSNADGAGVAFRRRDPAEFRRLFSATLRAWGRVSTEWGDISERYKKAVPELTSRECWKQTFER